MVGLDVSAHFNGLSDLHYPDTCRGDHDNSHAAEGRSFDRLHHGLVVSLRDPGRQTFSPLADGKVQCLPHLRHPHRLAEPAALRSR